jgi:hypothetical protein
MSLSLLPVAPRARSSTRGLAAALALLAAPPGARAASAQTDYYNTDAGRPVRIEDAYPVERRAVELQLAPLRLERARGGVYHWSVEPELAVGLLPRTQLELGVPLTFADAGPAGRRTGGLAGVDLALLHNLNAETAIPALGIAADLLLPVGSLAPDRAYASVTGIATRTLPWARFHVNARYTFGERPSAPTLDGAADVAAPGAAELSRWLAGVAVDRTLALRSLLLTAEAYARQPLAEGSALEWNAGGGARYQLSPRVAADGGAGYRLTGDDPGWYVTVGAAVAVGLPWRGGDR